MAKDKNLMLSIDPNKVMHTSISKSRNGYNSANMHIKVADDEYMAVSYEWSGKNVPSFVIDLMAFMKSNNVETSGVWKGHEEAYKEFSCKDCDEHKKDKDK